MKQNEFLEEEQFLIDIQDKFSKEVENAMPTIIQKAEARGELRGELKGIEKVAENMLYENQNLSDSALIEWVKK